MNFSKPKSRDTQQTPILTRLARLSDATQVNSLLLEFLKVPDKARIGEIRKSIRQKEILVSTVKRHAAGKEKVIGFIHGAIHNDPISAGPLLYVTALYVIRPYRNKGIGSELLNSIIQRSVRNFSIRGVEVGTARKHALKFYLKRGFTQFRADFGEKLLGLDVGDWKGLPRPCTFVRVTLAPLAAELVSQVTCSLDSRQVLSALSPEGERTGRASRRKGQREAEYPSPFECLGG